MCAGPVSHERRVVCAYRSGIPGAPPLQKPHTQLCQHSQAGKLACLSLNLHDSSAKSLLPGLLHVIL